MIISCGVEIVKVKQQVPEGGRVVDRPGAIVQGDRCVSMSFGIKGVSAPGELEFKRFLVFHAFHFNLCVNLAATETQRKIHGALFFIEVEDGPHNTCVSRSPESGCSWACS